MDVKAGVFVKKDIVFIFEEGNKDNLDPTEVEFESVKCYVKVENLSRL